MFMMEDMESSTSHSSGKKDHALKASEKAKSKKINAKPPSSSSESEDKSDSSEAESDDAKLALLMKRTTRMLSKIGKKGYNYDPKKQKFRASRSGEGSNRKCYNCVRYDHLSYDPSPTSESQAQERRTMKMTKMPSTTRRALPRRSHQTSPTTRRRVNIVLSWSMNGLPVVKLQVNQVSVKKTRTRRLPILLSWMMKSLHSHLHQCASWQSTPR
jgi:hypothetical protein